MKCPRCYHTKFIIKIGGVVCKKCRVFVDYAFLGELLREVNMAQHKPSTTKKSGNGSKRK